MPTVLGGLAKFKHELIHSRTSEGRLRAKARDTQMGQLPSLTVIKKEEALEAISLCTTTRTQHRSCWLLRVVRAQGTPLRIATAWARFFMTALSCVLLASAFGGCGSEGSSECAPQNEGSTISPDGDHVAQQWVSICGFPGATVADIVSVSTKSITGLPSRGTFVFFENQGSTSRDQIRASWLDSHRLQITINAVGEVSESPNEIGGVAIVYTLGSDVNLQALAAHKQSKIDERQQWERLKTSAAWHYVKNYYDFDAYIIQYDQKFIDWARDRASQNP